MQAELEDKKPLLIRSGEETAALISLVEVQAAEADQVKTLVKVGRGAIPAAVGGRQGGGGLENWGDEGAGGGARRG